MPQPPTILQTDRATGSREDETVRRLQRLLLRGELGEPLPPERQLADLFGVSRITLRRALSQLEEACVVRREQGRGTFSCDGPAMTTIDELASLKQPCIAVLVRQPGPWFNPQLTPWTWRVCCALTPLLERSSQPLCLVNDEQFLAATSRGRLSRRQVTGFIAPTHQWDGETYEAALRCELPWIGLGRSSRSMFWNILDLDWSDALRTAIETIAPSPRDRVFIPSAPHPREVDQQGWLEAAMTILHSHGVPRDRIVVKSDGPFESQGYLATRRYLKQHGEPTLILGPFDLTVAGAYRALQAHSQRKLSKLRLLGAANLEIGRYLSPTLSTLSVDYDGIAQHIMEIFASKRSVVGTQPLHIVEAGYIQRESTEGQG